MGFPGSLLGETSPLPTTARGVAPLKPCILQGWSVCREMYLWGRFTYTGKTSQTPIGQVPAQRNGEGGCVSCDNVSGLHTARSVMRVPRAYWGIFGAAPAKLEGNIGRNVTGFRMK